MNDDFNQQRLETERLSRHDTAFILLDNEVTCHEGCGVSIFQGTVPFDHLLRRTIEVIPEAPKFLQRPVHVPLGLGHPTWEYDPDFDIHYHVQRLHLERPGTDEQLWELCHRLANERLNPKRPLWRTFLIEGLSGGRSVMFAKIHHSLTDGMGAIKVMMANIEVEAVTPEPIPEDTPLPTLPAFPPLPTRVQRVARAMRENVRATGRNIRNFPRNARRWIGNAKSPNLWRGLRLVRTYLTTPTVRFRFNRGLSGTIHFAGFRLPLADLRAIRAHHGGTVNDVLLAVVSGALDRYAVHHGYETTGRFMRLQVPKNIRQGAEHDKALGNHVGSVPLLVPFGVEHPVERLKGITESMREAKDCNVGYGIRKFLDGFEALLTPPGMHLVFGFSSLRIVQRFMAKLPRDPNIHLYVSNMPGPEFPTYTLGCKLLERYPMGPVIPQTGLAAAAMTSDQHLYVGFTGDVETVPDVQWLADESEACFEELCDACGLRGRNQQSQSLAK